MAGPAGLPLDVLKGFHQAYVAGGHSAMAQAIQVYAAQTGMTTAAVWTAIRASSYHAVTRGLAGTLTPLVRQAIGQGLLSIGGAAGPAAAGGGGLVAWFGGLTAAVQVGLIVGIIGLTVGGAWVAGTWSGDDPIVPVDRTAVPFTDPNTAADTGTAYVGFGAYDNGRLAIVSVRTTDAVAAGIPWCDFHLGGMDCDTKAPTRILTAEYDNAVDATRELCGQLSGPPFEPALSDGYRAPMGTDSVVVDDWSALDVDACTAAAGG